MKDLSSSAVELNEDGSKAGNHGQRPWIGVDLDGTLCEYSTWKNMGVAIGRPVPAMVERVKRWLASGTDVKIFTARACEDNWNAAQDIPAIKEMCVNLFGKELEITCKKDFAMAQLWDDRCVTVEHNTGYRTSRSSDMALHSGDPLTPVEEIDLLQDEDAITTALHGGLPKEMR